MSRDGRLDLDDPQLNAGLGEAVGRFGSDLWTRPGLIRATLSDALGEAAISFRGEIDLLEQSAEIGLAAAVSASGPTDTVLAELRDAGIDPPVAEQLVGVDHHTVDHCDGARHGRDDPARRHHTGFES